MKKKIPERTMARVPMPTPTPIPAPLARVLLFDKDGDVVFDIVEFIQPS